MAPTPKASDEDDELMVNMLLHLKYSSTHQARPGKLVTNLSWGVTKPRSASVLSGSKSNRRCSPCTPLSWSGGGDAVAVEGCEASSQMKFNLDGCGVIGARSNKLRKKKTYTEHVGEELLLKESMRLNQLDWTTKLTKNDEYSAGAASGFNNASSTMKAESCERAASILSHCRPSKSIKAECDPSPTLKQAKFLLPDLNMMPPPEMDSRS